MPRKSSRSATKKPAQSGITVENAHPDISRISTKSFSLDHAIGGGLPLRTVVEISGYEYSAKSTVAYHLCGVVREAGTVCIADFENLDAEYVARAMQASGFHGTLRLVPLTNDKHKPLMSEDMLNLLSDYISEEEVQAALVDSVGAIYTISEEEGNVGEGRVGRRAQITADFLRKCVFRLRWKENPSIVILTNHVHEIIGGRGTITAGGKAVAYLSSTRMRLQADKKDDRWIINGKIGKIRFRGNKPVSDVFQLVVVPGEGVHLGLSAVQDCITYGLAKEERTVSLDGKSYGYMSKIVAQRDDPELFAPFHAALETVEFDHAKEE